MVNPVLDSLGQRVHIVREGSCSILGALEVDYFASGLHRQPLGIVQGTLVVRKRREIIRGDDEESSSELFGVLLELVLRHLAPTAFPHGLEVGKVVLVDSSLEVKLERSVDLSLPALVGILHSAVTLLEVELLGAEDLPEEFDESSLARVPITIEPDEALLGILAVEENTHKSIKHGSMPGFLESVHTGFSILHKGAVFLDELVQCLHQVELGLVMPEEVSDGLLQLLELLLVFIDDEPGPLIVLQRVMELLGCHAHLLCHVHVFGLQFRIELEVGLLPVVHRHIEALDGLLVVLSILVCKDTLYSGYEEELVQFSPCYSAIQPLPVHLELLHELFELRPITEIRISGIVFILWKDDRHPGPGPFVQVDPLSCGPKVDL